MDEELVRTADAYVQEGMALSRTEMIEDALRFYLGFLSAEKAEDYLLQSLSSMLGATVKDSENRLARMDFKSKRLKFSHSKKLTGYFSVAGVP